MIWNFISDGNSLKRKRKFKAYDFKSYLMMENTSFSNDSKFTLF